MYPRLALLFLSAGIVPCSPAQQVIQLTYPLGPDWCGNNSPQNTATLLADGGYFMATHCGYDLVIFRTDAAGQVQWSRSYLPVGYVNQRVCSLGEFPDGDLMVVVLADLCPTPVGHIVMRFQPDGDLNWAYFLDVASTGDNQNSPNGMGLITAEGNIRLMYAGGHGFTLTEVNGDGTLAWSYVFEPTYDDPLSIPGKNSCWPSGLTLTADGGAAVCGGTISGSFIVRTNSVGGMVWGKGYSTGGAQWVAEKSNGHLVVTGSDGGNSGMLLGVNTSGEAVFMRRYPEPWLDQVLVLPNDEMLLYSTLAHKLIRTDAEGVPLSAAIGVTGSNSGPFVNMHIYDEGDLVISGTLWNQPEPGVTTSFPFLYRQALSALDDCWMQPLTITSTAGTPPNDVEGISRTQTFPTWTAVALTPGEFAVTAQEFCDIILGVQPTVQRAPIEVFPTLIDTDAPLRIVSNADDRMAVVLFDVQGRAITSLILPPHDALEFPTHGLAHGVYTVRVEGPGSAHMQRVVIAR